MSQQTHLAWYSDSESIDQNRVLQEVPKLLGLKRAEFVCRTFETISTYEDDDWEREQLGEDVPAAQLPAMYKPGTSLHISDDLAAIGDRIEEAITEGLEEDIRGTQVPGRAYFEVGKHYFIDAADDSGVSVPYTAIVGFWCYSTPNNYAEMRRQVFRLPALCELKTQLEAVMGSLQDAMYLHF